MAAEEPTVRPLGYSDLPAVISIERRAFPTPWSLAMFVLELAKPSGIYLGGPARGRVAGYLICSRYADIWHLMNIAVDPGWRRRGLGAAMLSEMLRRIGEDGACTLEVRTSNSPAIELYERFGFRAAGTRPRYYRDTGEDALIMWRTAADHSATSPQSAG